MAQSGPSGTGPGCAAVSRPATGAGAPCYHELRLRQIGRGLPMRAYVLLVVLYPDPGAMRRRHPLEHGGRSPSHPHLVMLVPVASVSNGPVEHHVMEPSMHDVGSAARVAEADVSVHHGLPWRVTTRLSATPMAARLTAVEGHGAARRGGLAQGAWSLLFAGTSRR